ncbi:MAG: GAF domain-containing sensor histidine kinase, partial [Caldilineaceae bacterium]|nr:GAF domain-containing sensor histidine kinase [Caldilineaceae bacterium]
MTQNCVNIGSLSVALSQLSPLVDQHRFAEYWKTGLQELCDHVGALAARLYLLAAQSPVDDHYVVVGEMPQSCVEFLLGWEEMLLEAEDHGIGEYGPSWSRRSVSACNGLVTSHHILHFPITGGGILQGVASLVFGHDVSSNAATSAQAADGSEQILPLSQNDCTAVHANLQFFATHAFHVYHLAETRGRLEQATLLSQISQAITSSLDLKTVFNQTTEMAAATLNAQAATLFTIDTKRRELVFMIAKGAAAQVLEEKRIPLEQGVVGWVAVHGQPLVVNNARESALFDSHVDSQTGFSTRNILCVPLRIQDRTIGVLEVLNKETAGGFTQEDIEWLTAMSRPIAIALENAQLYENLRREQERIIKAQEEVRNHLARELHDNTAQMLSLIIMNLDLARQLLAKQNLERLDAEIQRIEEYAKQANREVRTLLFELRPIILESRGLVPALHAYHRQLQGSMTSKIHLNAEPLGVEISLQGASIIFSIIQEAVNNIRKHARAKNIWIRVHIEDGKLHFDIEDDGVGFDLSAVSASYAERGSFGLINMRERAALLAGYLDIYSPRPNSSNGTLITAFVPLSSMISSQETKQLT